MIKLAVAADGLGFDIYSRLDSTLRSDPNVGLIPFGKRDLLAKPKREPAQFQDCRWSQRSNHRT